LPSCDIWLSCRYSANNFISRGVYKLALMLKSYGDGPSTSSGQNTVNELLNAARAMYSASTFLDAAMTSQTCRMWHGSVRPFTGASDDHFFLSFAAHVLATELKPAWVGRIPLIESNLKVKYKSLVRLHPRRRRWDFLVNYRARALTNRDSRSLTSVAQWERAWKLRYSPGFSENIR
jgi:hypothetical protein